MRILVGVLLCIFIFTQIAIGNAGSAKITRITLSASDKIDYESTFVNNPPRLILKFKTHNILGRLTGDIKINQGPIKNIGVVYYPVESGVDQRYIKFLTFWLEKGTSYKIWDSGNEIFVDIKNPFIKTVQISDAVNLKDGASNLMAASALLSQFVNTPKPIAAKNSSQDLLWILAFMVAAIYVMWLRPDEWRRFVSRFVNPEVISSFRAEKRRWWRHNLLPLKKKNIYAKIDSFDSKTKLRLTPRDLGYGGLSFECNKVKKLKGELDIRLFMPDRVLPLELKGNVVWQRNFWNPLRRLIGVSFVNPPEKEWANVHRYLEEQYAALNL
jgi:hypothetical protein